MKKNSVVITQPMLFPWSGFFEQLMLADEYIYLEDVQFSKGSFTNRVQVFTGEQRSWMTIPLLGKGSFQQIIDLQSAGDGWKKDHKNLLSQSLKGLPFIDDALNLVDEAYDQNTITDLLITSIETTARYLGIGQDRHISRSINLGVTGESSDRVLNLVKKVGGTNYLTGNGAANYLDHKGFEREGVSVEYVRYSCMPYSQPCKEFTPYISILDLIARMGPESVNLLRGQTIPWQNFLKEKNIPF